MGREEIVEEREVLDSIFPEEITDVSDTSYRISVALDIPREDDDEPPPSLLLTITCPESYPDTAPLLDLSVPPNAPKHTNLDIVSDRSQLLDALAPVIDENLGMAMVFTLVSTLKDAAEALIAERVAAAQIVKDVEAAKAEEEENRKFHGTAVTRESFLKWREQFRREMEEEEEKKREEREGETRARKVKEEKLTGRMLWERGLVGKIEEDEEEGEEVVKGMGDLKIGD